MKDFFQYHEETGLNERQRKVLRKMLESYPENFVGGLTNKKYVSMTKISPETAKRDIKDLVDKGVLITSGAGRSTSYQLNKTLN